MNTAPIQNENKVNIQLINRLQSSQKAVNNSTYTSEEYLLQEAMITTNQLHLGKEAKA